MVTIDNYDIKVYMRYAQQTALVEQIKGEYHLDEAMSIPAQTRVIDVQPRTAEMDLLFDVRKTQSSWAFFPPPPLFRRQRRSPFGFFRIAPSLGSFEEEEEHEKELDDIECETEEDEKEKKVIKNCFEQIKKINTWLSFIIGRVGQFLQG